MPHVSDRFSAYPVSVVLDGSGNGTVRFQAVGQNVRITNLYVAVSRVIAQAKCTMYKNLVSPAAAIKTTNSGSTGASATGAIDLIDGETVIVVWTGGDAGATATATFSGHIIPFDVKPEGSALLSWDDPFAAGDGTIIFPALKSPNYVQGVSGWMINRDGTVEFDSGVFRGDLVITDPVTGSGIEIHSVPFGGVEIVPPTALNVLLNGELVDDSTSDAGQTFLSSPKLNNVGPGDQASILLTQGFSTTPSQVTINGDLVCDQPARIDRYMANDGTVAGSAAVGAVESIALTATDNGVTATFKAGRAYRCMFHGNVTSSVANTDALMRIRKDNGTNNPPTGQQLASGRFAVRLAGNPYDASWSTVFIVGANDVTAKIVLTMTGSAGNNASIASSAVSPAEFIIYDDGDAADHLAFAATLV